MRRDVEPPLPPPSVPTDLRWACAHAGDRVCVRVGVAEQSMNAIDGADTAWTHQHTRC